MYVKQIGRNPWKGSSRTTDRCMGLVDLWSLREKPCIFRHSAVRRFTLDDMERAYEANGSILGT